jgi:hypothetical protein
MVRMASLGSAGNVHATCLRILRAKGYALRRDIGRYEDDDGPYGYLAEKDGFTFAADDPIELLGLTAIYEHVRPTHDEPYWWFVEGPDIRDEITERAIEEALADLRQRDPERWATEVRKALAQADADATASERLGISEAELQRIMKDPLLR